MEKAHTHIEHSIARKKKGELIFPTDFRGQGTAAAIKKALSRLTQQGKLKRLSHGIYYVPKVDPVFGEIYPSPAAVAAIIAKKEKVSIRPAGAYALNQLGLSTQVPTKLVYLTDGVPRQLKIGKVIVQFKSTTQKKLAARGDLSGLIIQALEELDTRNMNPETEKRIMELLLKEDPKKLQHDMKLAPARIHDYILNLLKQSK
ncbi:MAG: DUF6088 family protein [Ferruginibacter sp.]